LPLFDQVIYNVLLECRSSLLLLLQIWQNQVTLKTYCNVS